MLSSSSSAYYLKFRCWTLLSFQRFASSSTFVNLYFLLSYLKQIKFLMAHKHKINVQDKGTGRATHWKLCWMSRARVFLSNFIGMENAIVPCARNLLENCRMWTERVFFQLFQQFENLCRRWNVLELQCFKKHTV